MTHVLDCDGISTHLFHVLGKDSKRFEAARVFIPPTIVFDNGFASAWYNSTPNMEVKLHMAKNITAELILSEFSSGNAHPHDIVATFVEVNNLSSRDTDVPVISSYFTRDELEEFLFSAGQKPRGLLQKFEYPKGLCNTTIQATWSPSVTVAEAMRNPYSIADRGRTAAEKCATFESKLASQVALTNSVSSAVKRVCELVAEHIQLLEPLQVLGMVLHLKVTKMNRVVLLFSTSIRVAQRKSFSTSASPLDLHPLMLNQAFVTREDHKRSQDLKQHLALFGPKGVSHSPLRGAKLTRESPPRVLNPLIGGNTRALLYAARFSALTSFVSAPTALPSAVLVNQRWYSTAAKSSPLQPNDLLAESQTDEQVGDISAANAASEHFQVLDSPSTGAESRNATQRTPTPAAQAANSSDKTRAHSSSDAFRDLVLEIVYDLESLLMESPVGPLVHAFAICGIEPAEMKILSNALLNFATKIEACSLVSLGTEFPRLRCYTVQSRENCGFDAHVVSFELPYNHRFKAISTLKVRARAL